jgi:hypothetical protein
MWARDARTSLRNLFVDKLDPQALTSRLQTQRPPLLMGTTRTPKSFSAGFKPARKSAVLLQAEGAVWGFSQLLRERASLELRFRPDLGA